MILVTGTPRSGTSYLTALLRQYGLDIGHEHVKPGGTISGFFFVDHYWYPYGHNKNAEKRAQFDFKVFIRLVRDPLRTIPSLAVLIDKQYKAANNRNEVWYPEVGIETDKNRLLWSALNVWVKTHSFIKNEDLTLRLETIEEQWPDVQRILDIHEPFRDTPIPNVSFKQPVTTWDKLVAEDRVLAIQAQDLAKGFGYA